MTTKSAASRVVVCLCFLTGAAASASAQDPLRLGSEFQVNAFTTEYQRGPAVAIDSDGDFVVVWNSIFQDGYSAGVFLRRFGSTGVSLGVELQVNSFTASAQSGSAVARDTDGDFVVVWHSNGQDGSLFGVFGRRFNSAGSPVAVEFQINQQTADSQVDPDLDLDAAGNFVAVWTSYQDGSGSGIFGRRFNAAGSPLATEFQVNSYTGGNQNLPQVALDANGDFVVVWNSTGQDGSGNGIFSRRFTSSGVGGIETPVNTHTESSQFVSDVAIDAVGDFVVAWESAEQDGSDYGIFARRFNVLGAPVATEFQVNILTAGVQRQPHVDMDAGGAFVVVWRSVGQDGSDLGVFARYFDASGTPRSGEFQVNTYTSFAQYRGDVAMDANGDFVIAWQSGSQDGSSDGVFAQRFSRAAVLDIDGDGDVGALTDGLLVLRYLFGFTGTTLTSGAVGSGCTRCNAAAIEPYLQGLV